MAVGLVHGSPYPTVRAIGAWAVYRQHYLRGRLLLAGVRMDDLTLSELVDVAHVAMIEPYLSGAWVGVDQVLDDLEKAFVEAEPNRETFGTTAVDIRAAHRAEELFPAARRREPPSTVAPE